MTVDYLDLLKVVTDHSKSKLEFVLFEGAKTNIGNTKVYPATLIAENGNGKALDSKTGVYEVSVPDLIIYSFDIIAKVKIDDVIIGERPAVGEPFIAIATELFKETKYEKLVRDDILAQQTNREKVLPDMTESTAASLMRGFIEWRKAGNE
ncbi:MULTISPECIES: hypothetical protein [unclassified Lactococcus]|uniref:hypothetical protein n=1 Tax=unclassified Lactococcus TaxID=2643510 RepID=UPI0011CB0B53|nr:MULTISPECIES: hypothetical protein [unclassified Lactococcus]MQW24014.1 hypothetical protein [Lactococcus sp. dk101]TXK36617.1 hypothetical protein FVP42_11095 [Lactococcus sp. dk310]TXK46929.1 hypothetical protein FVP43_10700 [Lactococcus sp. dk322]